MNSSEPSADSLYANASAMNVIAGEHTHQFVFPDVDNTRQHLENIIAGHEYPPWGLRATRLKRLSTLAPT